MAPSPELPLPIVPASPSLASHVQALTLLSAQLAALPTQSRWPARIPLTSKGSVRAQLVHTNEVKINVGGAWWVEMTAEEARAYVERRKRALLEEHARAKEGQARASFSLVEDAERGPGTAGGGARDKDKVRLPDIRFNPIFRLPPGVTNRGAGASTAEAGSSSPAKRKNNLPRQPRRADQLVSPDAPEDQQPVVASGETVRDLVAEPVESQRVRAESPAQGKQLSEQGLVNEQGLPIRDIRETSDGVPLDPDPADPAVSLEPEELIDDREEEADYWSAEAEARRAALRRKILDGASDSNDTDEELDAVDPIPASSPARPPTPPHAPSSHQSLNTRDFAPVEQAPSPSSPDDVSSLAPPPPTLRRRSSASAPPPGRSILKGASRKKSVSFDPALPSMPASPGLRATTPRGPSRFGFALPGVEVATNGGMDAVRLGAEADQAEGGKPVPILPEPKPPARAAQGGFAGFRPGFLTAKPASRTTVAQLAGSPADPPAAAPGTPSIPKKLSRFGQQRATEPEAGPSKASGLKDSSSVKAVVIEKVFERPAAAPVAVRPAKANPQAASAVSKGLGSEGDNEDDDEEYEVDEEEEEDEEDEEDYDLDERLLAREIALEQHRRQNYRSQHLRDADEEALLREMTAEHDSGQGDDSDLDGEGGGGVVLGLPSISTLDASGQPTIVNPTPDSIRQFVRVGRLDNGNLVLAPGEEGWSDTDEENAEGEEASGEGAQRRRNRREMKRRLMAGDFRDVVIDPTVDERTGQADVGLPPAVLPVQTASSPDTSPGLRKADPVAPAVTERQPTRTSQKDTAVVASQSDTRKPQKVSRFKAQRGGA